MFQILLIKYSMIDYLSVNKIIALTKIGSENINVDLNKVSVYSLKKGIPDAI